MVDVDEVIAEVAKRNGIALTRDDPILVMATLHELLLQATADQQKALLAEFREAMERNSDHLTSLSLQRAQAILKEAMKTAHDAAASSAEQGLRGLSSDLFNEISYLQSMQNRLQWFYLFNFAAVLLLAIVVVTKL